jgi:predicted lipid carrier protein YhbT
VEQYFDSFLAEKMHKQLLPNLKHLTASCRITVEDLPGRSWSLRIDQGRLEEISQDGMLCQCTFSLHSDTFSAIVGGRLAPQQAFFQRKIHIAGDMETGLKLATVLADSSKNGPTTWRRTVWDSLTTILADRSRWISLVCLCSAAIPVYWLRNARVDNSIEVWTGTRSKTHRNYQQFLEKYGNEEFVVIAGEAEDPLSEEALAFQGDLASRLRQIDGVEGVLDITQAAAAFEKYRPDD